MRSGLTVHRWTSRGAQTITRRSGHEARRGPTVRLTARVKGPPRDSSGGPSLTTKDCCGLRPRGAEGTDHPLLHTAGGQVTAAAAAPTRGRAGGRVTRPGHGRRAGSLA